MRLAGTGKRWGRGTAPEEMDEAVLRRRLRDGLWEMAGPLLMLLLAAGQGMIMSRGRGGWERVLAQLEIGWLTRTALVLFLGTLLIWIFVCGAGKVVEAMRWLRVLRGSGTSRERPLGASGACAQRPGAGSLCTALRFASRALLVLALCFALLAFSQWRAGRTKSLPEMADGPYLVLRDLGIEGQRTLSQTASAGGRQSEISHSRSLFAESWELFENVRTGERDFWMYQDVYRLKSPQQAARMAKLLRANATFASSPSDFQLVEIPGLDGAWVLDRLDCVALKGDLVCYLTIGSDDQETLVSALRAVGERWGEE